MSSIPFEKFEGSIQTDRERLLFLNHPNISVKYLFGRLPLSLNSLNIIKHHHSYHSLIEKNSKLIVGYLHQATYN